MKIYMEESLTNFEFWSGAKDTVKYLTDEELEQIESILEDTYPEGMSDTEINDLFWFEDDTIAEWLGYNDFEEIISSAIREYYIILNDEELPTKIILSDIFSELELYKKWLSLRLNKEVKIIKATSKKCKQA